MKTRSLLNFTTKLKNSKSSTVYVPFNFAHKPLIKLLYKEGYILSVDFLENSDFKIVLRTNFNSVSLIKSLKSISTPGKFSYLNYNQICLLNLSGKVGFFTTSKGFLTSNDCKKYRIGGTYFFVI